MHLSSLLFMLFIYRLLYLLCIRVEEERCKYKITPKCVIEEETEVLGKKPFRGPSSRNNPLVNKVGVQRYQKNIPSLIYPMYLNPLSSSSQWTSPCHVFTNYLDLQLAPNCICQSMASSNTSHMHQNNSQHSDWVRYVRLRTS